jgi:plasmid maintenance system antidote protein VapI
VEKVKQLVSAGSSLVGAVKEALADKQLDISGLAEKRDIDRKELSAVLNLRVVPTPRVLAALSAELGGTPDEWTALWWRVASPPTAKKKAAAGR